jgi:hypothetical protein
MVILTAGCWIGEQAQALQSGTFNHKNTCYHGSGLKLNWIRIIPKIFVTLSQQRETVLSISNNFQKNRKDLMARGFVCLAGVV